MAFRDPRYSHVHAWRDGARVFNSIGGGGQHADFPFVNLIDDRAGTLFKFATSATNNWVVCDLGASGFETGLDRLIIPANHNIVNINVGEDDDNGMSGFGSLKSAVAATPGTLIDLEFESASTKRFIGVRFNGTDQWFMPQIFCTKIVTLTAGPDLGNSTDEKRANFARQLQPTGLSPTVQLGPQQRFIEYRYESPIEGADLTAMEALVDEVGMDKPFYVDPASFSTPPETDEPALWMKFAEMPQSRNTVLVPMSGTRSKAYTLSLIESLD